MIQQIRDTQTSQTHRKYNSGCHELAGEGNGTLVFNRQKVPVQDDDNVLEMNGGVTLYASELHEST